MRAVKICACQLGNVGRKDLKNAKRRSTEVTIVSCKDNVEDHWHRGRRVYFYVASHLAY